MREGGRRASGLVVLIALVLLAAAPAAPAAVPGVEVIEQERISDRLIELTIDTPAFTEPTKVHVFLPTGYREDRRRRWPVTYFTAGTSNNYDSLENLLDGQALLKDFPSILVSPDGNSGYWSDWYNAGEFGPPMYETYVIDQLIPLIDDRYRTIDDRSRRAIFGISMGGYGSMMLAARHPDLFAAAATLSGAVDSNLPANGAVLSATSTFDGGEVDAIHGPRATQEVRWHGHNPTDLASNLRGLDIQVRSANAIPNPGIGENPASADGVSCVIEGGVYMASINFHQKLEALGIDHRWTDYGPGCHTFPNFEREVIDTLEELTEVFERPRVRFKRFSHRAIEPQFSIRGWRVATDPGRALEFMRLQGARRLGFTLVGSGRTQVRTPRFYRRLDAVDVVAEGVSETLRPDRRGRLELTVDLGPPHPDQQYTTASRLAGEGGPGYFEREQVSLRPHGKARIRLLADGGQGPVRRVCVRAIGTKLRKARIVVADGSGELVARSRSFSQPVGRRCGPPGLGRLHPGPDGLTVRLRGKDRFGHRVTARERLAGRQGR